LVVYTDLYRCAASILLLLGASSGCGGSSNGKSDDAAPTDAGSEASDKCPADTPEFVATPENGLIAMGKHGGVEARIIAANPAMPERFENTWTVRFLDSSQQALAGVDIADACVFMPAHGHGGKPKAVSMQNDAGTFELNALNLFMRGPWEVQLAVNAPGADQSTKEFTSCDRNRESPGQDLIVFRVCVPDD
jgi:hypothetical protein